MIHLVTAAVNLKERQTCTQAQTRSASVAPQDDVTALPTKQKVSD